jgi:hypothetical protein
MHLASGGTVTVTLHLSNQRGAGASEELPEDTHTLAANVGDASRRGFVHERDDREAPGPVTHPSHGLTASLVSSALEVEEAEGEESGLSEAALRRHSSLHGSRRVADLLEIKGRLGSVNGDGEVPGGVARDGGDASPTAAAAASR